MALHTIVFLGLSPATGKTLSGISDEVFGLLDLGLIPPLETRLVAVAAGGIGLDLARLEQRSMDITPANIHPLNILPWPSPASAWSRPARAPRLPKGEAVTAWASGSGEATAVVCWCADRLEPAPEGENFLLSFGAGATLVDNSWVRTELLWDVPYLPVGRYHVLGMEVHAVDPGSSVVVAARLVLPNQVHRPGALVFTNTTLAEASAMLPPPFQSDESLGSWGWFEQGSPPKIEVVGFGSDAVVLRGHLLVVKAPSGERAPGGPWG